MSHVFEVLPKSSPLCLASIVAHPAMDVLPRKLPGCSEASQAASGGKARRRFSLKAAICGRLGIYSVLPSVVCSHVERQEGVHDRQVKRPSELGGV